MFELVLAHGELRLDEDRWTKIRFLLMEFQPAQRVSLVGTPPDRIRVEARGEPEIAPAVLARVEQLVGMPMQLQLVSRSDT